MTKFSRTLAAGIVALAGLAALNAQAATELVSNGGFETGDFTGWTTTDAPFPTSMYNVDTAGPHNGDYSAFFGGTGPDSDSISQAIATTAGASYLVSFYLANPAGTPDGSFTASLGGVQFFSAPMSAFAFGPMSFTVSATGDDSVLSFGGFNTGSDFYTLDSVSVMAAVPEPSTYALLLTGLLAVGAYSRRQRR
ncbi:MAG: hypothetical protein JWP52_2199 [Rhizobacter sp.]|nr:hypothetical protein [Rhizobacter sp.]